MLSDSARDKHSILFIEQRTEATVDDVVSEDGAVEFVRTTDVYFFQHP